MQCVGDRRQLGIVRIILSTLAEDWSVGGNSRELQKISLGKEKSYAGLSNRLTGVIDLTPGIECSLSTS